HLHQHFQRREQRRQQRVFSVLAHLRQQSTYHVNHSPYWFRRVPGTGPALPPVRWSGPAVPAGGGWPAPPPDAACAGQTTVRLSYGSPPRLYFAGELYGLELFACEHYYTHPHWKVNS